MADDELNEHVFLVAFDMTQCDDRDGAQRYLMMRLKMLLETERKHMARHPMSPCLDSWWIAEDDRLDRSDCDSAIFVPKGMTAVASELLLPEGAWPKEGDQGEEI